MYIYGEDTSDSMDASKQFERIFMVSINLRNSVESLRYEGRFLYINLLCGCIYQQIGIWVL